MCIYRIGYGHMSVHCCVYIGTCVWGHITCPHVPLLTHTRVHTNVCIENCTHVHGLWACFYTDTYVAL